MKKLTRKYLLIILAIACVVTAILAGCKVGYLTYEERQEMYGVSAKMTYYANDGYINDILRQITIESSEDTPFFNVGSEQSYKPTVTRTGYTIIGWRKIISKTKDGVIYFVKEDGTDITQADYEAATKTGNAPVLQTEAMDYNYRYKSGDNLFVIAEWSKNAAIKIMLVTDNEVNGEKGITLDDGTFVKNGEMLYEENFGTFLTVSFDPRYPSVKSTDATLVSYYAEPECTTQTLNVAKGEEDVLLYAKYLSGNDWTVVRNSTNVTSMFSSSTKNAKFYLISDMDMNGAEVRASVTDFTATIEGNGYTISNFKIKKTSLRNGTYSLFGNIKANAKLNNVTFSNITVEYETFNTGTGSMYALFSSVESGATLNGVKFKDITFGVQIGGDATTSYNVTNIGTATSEHSTSNWLFGGAESDSAFLATYTGVTVEGGRFGVKAEKYSNVGYGKEYNWLVGSAE